MKYSKKYNLYRQANKRKARQEHYHSVEGLKAALDEWYGVSDIPILVDETEAERKSYEAYPKVIKQTRIFNRIKMSYERDKKMHESDELDKKYVQLIKEKIYHAIVVRPKDLVKAFIISVAQKHDAFMDTETAFSICNVVHGLFNLKDWILDNILIKEERSMFYDIEEHYNLLKTTREENKLLEGKGWVSYGWRYNKPLIYELDAEYDKKVNAGDDPVFAGKIRGPSLESKVSST